MAEPTREITMEETRLNRGGTRPRRSVLGGMIAKYPAIQVAGANYTINYFSTNASVDIWVTKEPVNFSKIVKTCTNEINNVTLSEMERCAMYASAVIAILPGMKPIFEEHFTQLGYLINEIDDAVRAEAGTTLSAWMDMSSVAMYFGQLVVVLYKNISAQSYTAFMSRRGKEISARADIMEDSPDFKIVLTLDSATIIRRMIGANDTIRRAMLEVVIANEKTLNPIGRVCNYLMDILAWTEMSALIFIMDTLISTESPVLTDSRVASEIVALARAYAAITRVDYPQFYKILYPAEANKLLVRNKFATLLAVAQTCYKGISDPAENYQSTTASNNRTVTELLNKHKAYMRAQEGEQSG